ncbi:MAG: electron transfer flavoprotein subunit alpha/FixB family protein [Bacteroidota bacterium]|nr:electron transfer flavoprotein subunit alpha/FixB family protein [Candidatus Kapabacteria bacterium]MDW8219328.1 electron transfer flavoprotein subunit alpha/FixB family protein [Bacteroidota bacterium]
MNILVYLEAIDGKLKKTAFEAITAAHALAQQLSGSVVGIAIGSVDTSPAGLYGLTSCLSAQHPLLDKKSTSAYAETLAQAAQAEQAHIVLLPASATGKEIAARLAIKLQAGLAADTIAHEVVDGKLIVTRPVYAGKARLKITITTAQKVITIRPNVFTAKKVDSPVECTIRTFSPSLTEAHVKAVVTSVSRNTGKLDVAEADIIVSGGRGLKGPENFYLVENLASTLGGAVGASRAVVDAGWRPHSEQVGQTGKTVSPSLYVAAGISGAIQHLAGMSSSKVIVAINKDKDAPIFQIADYGIVGDVFDVLPKLNEHIKRAVGK